MNKSKKSTDRKIRAMARAIYGIVASNSALLARVRKLALKDK